MAAKTADRGEVRQASMRIPTDTIERLKDLAARNDRSMSAEIRHALRKHLEESGS